MNFLKDKEPAKANMVNVSVIAMKCKECNNNLYGFEEEEGKCLPCKLKDKFNHA
ncbi:MAG: hypothetical protein H8D23_01395 [Candidatus Brocadiales bacterium]|nr:hypothetical protein [Candidatus Brocadiales bacterium]